MALSRYAEPTEMRLNYGETIFKLVAFLRKFILLFRYLSMRIPIINDTIYDPKGCILSSKLPSITFAIFYNSTKGRETLHKIGHTDIRLHEIGRT